MQNNTSNVHRRFNPLTGQWVVVSPHRTKRPWQGAQENTAGSTTTYDPSCYLCPSNERISGLKNPEYTHTFVFNNDFPALLGHDSEQENKQNASIHDPEQSAYFRTQSISGTCRVVCFSPNHGLSLAQMNLKDIQGVIHTWIQEINTLSVNYDWVQVFENKGQAMGCSNPHPHAQIWASSFVPSELATEDRNLLEHFRSTGENFLLSYALKESQDGSRTVEENDDWIVVVPFWAAWPFETLLLPKSPIARLTDASDNLVVSLAECMKSLLVRYDNLFECSFPYSMGWHFAPYNTHSTDAWQLHAHYYPPLLRSAEVKKFMVGYEMLAETQRDLSPEQAAERLRACPVVHYTERKLEG